MSWLESFGSVTIVCDRCASAQMTALREDFAPEDWWDGAKAHLLGEIRDEGWLVSMFGLRHSCPACLGEW